MIPGFHSGDLFFYDIYLFVLRGDIFLPWLVEINQQPK